MTACEKKLNNAQLLILDFQNPKFSQLGFINCNMTSQYDDHPLNGFLSTPFCRCRALDREVNFSDFGAPVSPDNIPRKGYPGVTFTIYRCSACTGI